MDEESDIWVCGSGYGDYEFVHEANGFCLLRVHTTCTGNGPVPTYVCEDARQGPHPIVYASSAVAAMTGGERYLSNKARFEASWNKVLAENRSSRGGSIRDADVKTSFSR